MAVRSGRWKGVATASAPQAAMASRIAAAALVSGSPRLVLSCVSLDGRVRQAPLLLDNRCPVSFELLSRCAAISKLLAVEDELAKAFQNRLH
jgi:hypothetical protein